MASAKVLYGIHVPLAYAEILTVAHMVQQGPRREVVLKRLWLRPERAGAACFSVSEEWCQEHRVGLLKDSIVWLLAISRPLSIYVSIFDLNVHTCVLTHVYICAGRAGQVGRHPPGLEAQDCQRAATW